MMSTFLRPPRALSLRSPEFASDYMERFEAFRALLLAVSRRMIACRLRAAKREVMLEAKARARFARAAVCRWHL